MNLIFKNRRRQKKVKERQIGLQTNFKPISNRIAFRFAQNFLTLWKIAEGFEKRKKIQTGCTGNIYDPIKNGDLLAFGANGGKRERKWGVRGEGEMGGKWRATIWPIGRKKNFLPFVPRQRFQMNLFRYYYSKFNLPLFFENFQKVKSPNLKNFSRS